MNFVRHSTYFMGAVEWKTLLAGYRLKEIGNITSFKANLKVDIQHV